MSQHKWLKLGAATFLSIGMLAACGDEDEQLEYEDPGADFEDGGSEGPAPEVEEGDGDMNLETNPERDEDDNSDEELEEDIHEEMDENTDNSN